MFQRRESISLGGEREREIGSQGSWPLACSREKAADGYFLLSDAVHALDTHQLLQAYGHLQKEDSNIGISPQLLSTCTQERFIKKHFHNFNFYNIQYKIDIRYIRFTILFPAITFDWSVLGRGYPLKVNAAELYFKSSFQRYPTCLSFLHFMSQFDWGSSQS